MRPEESSRRTARGRNASGAKNSAQNAVYALPASSDTNKTTPKAPSPAPDANKVRVTVYKAYTGGKPFLDNPKAVIVPDTWEEFLASVGRKVNASRVASVETLDTGSVLEELNEIMHGDKLVIRCSPPPTGSTSPNPEETDKPSSQSGARPVTVSNGADAEDAIEKNLLDLIGDELENVSDQNQGFGGSGRLNMSSQGDGLNLMVSHQRDIMAGRALSIPEGGADVNDSNIPGMNTVGSNSMQSQMNETLNAMSGRRGRGSDMGGGLSGNQPSSAFATMNAQFQQQRQQQQRGMQQLQQQQQPNNQQQRFMQSLQNQQHVVSGSQQQQIQRLLQQQSQNSPMPLQFGGGGVNGMANSSASNGTGGGMFSMPMQNSGRGLQGHIPAAMAQLLMQQNGQYAPMGQPSSFGPGNAMQSNASLGGIGGGAVAGSAMGSQAFGRRSHEQARFSPLVQVLRDNLVATGAKEMDSDQIAQSLTSLMPDYASRLAVASVIDYIQEASQAGLVQVHRNGKRISASIRGNREVGVVKWVKESYGFIQSAAHAEDLFYHGSEVRSSRPLCATDEVEFLVVRNPFTGKLNATQIHLLHPNGPPKIIPGTREDMSALPGLAGGPVADGTSDDSSRADELGQLAQRMSSMGFSKSQIEDCMRSFHPNAVYGNADDEGPNGSKASVEANKEMQRLDFEKQKQALEQQQAFEQDSDQQHRKFQQDSGVETYAGFSRFADSNAYDPSSIMHGGGQRMQQGIGLTHDWESGTSNAPFEAGSTKGYSNDGNHDWNMVTNYDFQAGGMAQHSPGLLSPLDADSMFRPVEDPQKDEFGTLDAFSSDGHGVW